LHAFANHELLALELMCRSLVILPNTEELKDFKQDIVETIHDEQRHLQLYIKRINELGYEFGDFGINDFFWKHGVKVQTPAQYCSFMSLTFEMANLDFSHFYEQKFREVEDDNSTKIMREVFRDEIKHVKVGVDHLELWRENNTLWDYYATNLIFPLTPARSRGINYQEKFRRTVGLNEDFISNVSEFEDGFDITKRRP